MYVANPTVFIGKCVFYNRNYDEDGCRLLRKKSNQVNVLIKGCIPLHLLLDFIRKEMSHLSGVLEHCNATLYTVNEDDPTFKVEKQNVTEVSAAPPVGARGRFVIILLYGLMALGVLWIIGGFDSGLLYQGDL